VPTGHPIADETVAEEANWTYTVPDATFSGIPASYLRWRAAMADGTALPVWVRFDPVTHSFSGTAPRDFFGDLEFAVTVDDGSRVATQPFTLHVTNTEDAPRLVIPLTDVAVLEETPFVTRQYVTQDFIDPDGDALSFTATRDDGSALPTWLHMVPFSGVKLSFNGTPPTDFTGTIAVRITASDGTLTTSDVFDLIVAPINDAPVLALQTPLARVTPGAAFSLTLPVGSFTDVDSPVLTYGATRLDGSPLPSWLVFDPASRGFSGVAPLDFSGLTVIVSAADELSRARESIILATNAPVLVIPTIDQTVAAGSIWHYRVAADAFQDLDTPVLAYSARLADGTALPAWLSFDPLTRSFTGQTPANWAGTDIRVTASDGTGSADDVFHLKPLGDFSFAVAGSSTWGRNAPAEIHYRFDQAYFQAGNSWQVTGEEGFSAGPLFGGFKVTVGFNYNFQAGVLIDLVLRPDSFDLAENFRIIETTSTLAQATNHNPFVTVTAQVDPGSHFTITPPEEALKLHAFAGVTASVGGFIDANVHGGLHLPSLNFGLFSVSLPDITGSYSAHIPLDFIGLTKIEVTNSNINLPLLPPIGAIDVTLKSGDPAFDVANAFGISDWGSLVFNAFGGFSVNSYDVTPALGGAIPGLHVVADSAPIVSANADIDKMVTALVDKLFGIDLTALFHPRLTYDFGLATLAFGEDTDFALVGDLKLREEMTFTPFVNYTMTTSLGQTLSGVAGDTTVFDTPQGEGLLDVNATYTTRGQLTTTLSLVGNLHFDLALLAPAIDAKLNGLFSLTFPLLKLDPFYSTMLTIQGVTIPLYSNTDQYTLDQVRSDSFSLPYENFRTTAGSGDSFAATSHQLVLDGNDHDNDLVGNALANTISSGAGRDTVDGGAGNDSIDAGAGDDWVMGGPGDDSMLGGDGIDTMDYSLAPGPVTINPEATGPDGGGGTDFISGFENFLGSAFGDLLFGTFDANLTYGLDGNDTIQGFGGNDTLLGGNGNDSLGGGPGDDALFGDNGNDSLTGGAGNDALYGGTGSNTLAGGAGDDQYVIDNATDSIIENTDAGADTEWLGVDGVALAANVEIGRLFGGARQILGNNGDNTLVGNQATGSSIDGIRGDDVLWGGAFADLLNGNIGDDVIYGQGGADTMYGGLGNDQFVVGGAGTIIIENAGEGLDTAWLGIDGWTNFLNVEIARLAAPGATRLFGSEGNEDLVGNVGAASTLSGNGGSDTLWGSPFADTLNGGAGDDVLRGQGGADLMAGGTGNDQYVVFDAAATVNEAAGEGYDIVYYAGAGSFAIGNNVEEARLAALGTGLTGNGQTNLLVGNSSGLASTLDGAGGDDIVFGTPAADVFIGGAGDDTLYSQGGADIFRYQAAGWGVDQIAGFTAGAHLQFTVASGVTNFAQLNLNIAGGNTQVNHANGVILVFGAVLTQADFLFG